VTRRLQIVVAVVAATCVLAVLVSPLVPSPFTTLPSHHGWSVLPGMAVAAAAVSPLPSLAASYLPEPRLAWRPAGVELISLTCTRLC
jgi:hypothetical protein